MSTKEQEVCWSKNLKLSIQKYFSFISDPKLESGLHWSQFEIRLLFCLQIKKQFNLPVHVMLVPTSIVCSFTLFWVEKNQLENQKIQFSNFFPPSNFQHQLLADVPFKNIKWTEYYLFQKFFSGFYSLPGKWLGRRQKRNRQHIPSL